MKEIKDLMNEIRLKDEPGYKETAEMYLSVKIKDESGQIKKEKTFATVEELMRPLMEQAKKDENKRLILEKAAEEQGYLLLII